MSQPKPFIIMSQRGLYVASYDTQEEAEKVASGLGSNGPYLILHLVNTVEGFDIKKQGL